MSSSVTLAYPDLEAIVSTERLKPYLDAARGSQEVAAELYAWNVEVSGALWGLIVYLEIALRNALARELQALRMSLRSRRSGTAPLWFNNSTWFTPRQRQDIRKAKAKAAEVEFTAGKVIRQLTFGFWVSLVDPGHTETLWVPGLRHAFPNSGGGHKPVRGKLGWVNDLRNDIAHHNRLLDRRIVETEEELLRTAYWMDPKLADWMAAVSTVRLVNARRPAIPPTLRWPAPAPTF